MGRRHESAGSAALAEIADVPLDLLEGKALRVSGHRVIIGKLSLDQYLALAKLAVETVFKLDDKEVAALKAAAGTEDSDLTGVLSLLNTDTVMGIYSLLSGVPKEELGANFDAAEFAEVIDACDEYNDIKKVIAPFRRVVARWRPPSPTSAQQSRG